MEKYDFSEKDASDMSDFLVSILDFVPEKRPSAGQCLLHPWMNAGPRLLEPSVPSSNHNPAVPSSNHNPAGETATSDQKNKDKDEREAMEAGIGNIAINSDSKPLMHSPSKKAFQGSRK
jgi:serine/threonine-protein kinase SRPK3